MAPKIDSLLAKINWLIIIQLVKSVTHNVNDPYQASFMEHSAEVLVFWV